MSPRSIQLASASVERTSGWRKTPFTLEQLSAYDDILTDVLLDQVSGETSTQISSYRRDADRVQAEIGIEVRKMGLSYRRQCGLSTNSIMGILQCIARIRNISIASTMFCELPPISAFLESVYSVRPFHRCLRQYLAFYLPDCPVEPSLTTRYGNNELRLIARRDILASQEIKHLSGLLASLEPAELLELTRSGQDFSIVESDLYGTAVLLGPARFINHDCVPNARLVPSSRGGGVKIITMRDIRAEEEIFLRYGDHYFGPDNGCCMCSSCERGQRGRWSEGVPPPARTQVDYSGVSSQGSSQMWIPIRSPILPRASNEIGLSSSDIAQSVPVLGRRKSSVRHRADSPISSYACGDGRDTTSEMKISDSDSPLHETLESADLLTTSAQAANRCGTCRLLLTHVFLQTSSISCTRCSRHFRIYGVEWPLTKPP
jgi:SET domain